jgi:hypothetical protein
VGSSPLVAKPVAVAEVVLKDFGANKLAAVGVVHRLIGLGLQEATDRVESLPATVLVWVSDEAGESAAFSLREAGATAEIRMVPVDTVDLDRIIDDLKELRDIEFQERVWLRGEGPEVSDPVDATTRLFGDTLLAARLEANRADAVISEQADSVLLKLNRLLDELAPYTHAEELLSTPSWGRVRELADEAARLCIAARADPRFD